MMLAADELLGVDLNEPKLRPLDMCRSAWVVYRLCCRADRVIEHGEGFQQHCNGKEADAISFSRPPPSTYVNLSLSSVDKASPSRAYGLDLDANADRAINGDCKFESAGPFCDTDHLGHDFA
jgi:hypothetical protein